MNDTIVIAKNTGDPLLDNSTPLVTTKKKVSIALGAHSLRTRDLGPWKDDDWLVFGLNNLHRFVPRGHMWIQIHSPEYLANHPAYSKEDIGFYQTMNIPLFAQKHYPQWPTSIPMPKNELKKLFPRITWDSTMLYMAGLAVYMIRENWLPAPLNEGHTLEKRFGMWGLDMLDNYAKQGPNMGYLIGQAEAWGIEVVVPSQSGFFRRTWDYGYDEKEIGKRRSQLETRKTELGTSLQQLSVKSQSMTAELNSINQRIIATQAAIGENDYQLKNFVMEDDEVAPAVTMAEAAQRVERQIAAAKQNGQNGADVTALSLGNLAGNAVAMPD